MTLYHFSEDPTIEVFHPRPIPNVGSPYNTAPPPERATDRLVWAIDEAHAPLYWFPRDCPRITYWALPETTPADRERYFGHTTARWVSAIEGAWLARMQSARLYAYRLPPEPFVPQWEGGGPGYYIAYDSVVPLAVEPVGDLLARHADAGIELRITPSLWPLRHALLTASLHFSMIRMRNATPESVA